jgi:hypothetical protein
MELSRRGHEDWMAEHNPEGWSTPQWAAFVARLKLDGAYSKRVEALRVKRFAWVDTELSRQIGGRKINARTRLGIRKDLLHQSRTEIPNPDPLDGWTMPKNFKVGDAIVKGI